ncbi:hypothetical protein QFC20_007386 [Naganishia adeliensis]|uniref:Uncharacterized protein n=1 Tax=Naganishia adeliensis TaxID=92952 RepID=A0ACC2V080_9TREE|nr:hypothetical protein QFC20_007386 [Naganishia adeliensis]
MLCKVPNVPTSISESAKDPDGRKVVSRYPIMTGGKPCQLKIRQHDLEFLNPKTYVNEVMIEFGLSYNLDRSSPTAALKKNEVGILSTFFYNTIFNESKGATDATGVAEFRNAESWVDKHLLNRRLLLVPIHKPNHWIMAGIFNPSGIRRALLQATTSEDLDTGDNEHRCSILMLDSNSAEDQHSEDVERLSNWLTWKTIGDIPEAKRDTNTI